MRLTTKIIADKVIEVTGCNIRQRNRQQKMVNGRMIYIKLCRELLTVSLVQIGSEINKDHATVIHYQNKMLNPNYFNLYLQNTFEHLKSFFIIECKLKEYPVQKSTLRPLEVFKNNDKLLKQFKEKDKSYTQLLLKYNNLKLELQNSREDNQRLIEKNLKLSLKL